MISYYELLGMIKEDKAPRKIRVHLTSGTSKLYVREDDMDGTFNFYGLGVNEKENEEYHFYLPECFLESSMFEQTVEIIEEKKLEKMSEFYTEHINENGEMTEIFNKHELAIIDKINEIIEYIEEN